MHHGEDGYYYYYHHVHYYYIFLVLSSLSCLLIIVIIVLKFLASDGFLPPLSSGDPVLSSAPHSSVSPVFRWSTKAPQCLRSRIDPHPEKWEFQHCWITSSSTISSTPQLHIYDDIGKYHRSWKACNNDRLQIRQSEVVPFQRTSFACDFGQKIVHQPHDFPELRGPMSLTKPPFWSDFARVFEH